MAKRQKEQIKSKERLQTAALSITRWIGSPMSILAHSVVFLIAFSSVLLNIIQFDTLLLILNTIISLEAIYLALFNQLAINYANEGIEAVSKDIDEIQEDIDEIQEDVDEIQEDVDEIQEDVEEIQEDDKQDDIRDEAQGRTIDEIQKDLQKLIGDISRLQR